MESPTAKRFKFKVFFAIRWRWFGDGVVGNRPRAPSQKRGFRPGKSAVRATKEERGDERGLAVKAASSEGRSFETGSRVGWVDHALARAKEV